MFTFMHDDPKTYEFPGNLFAIFAFMVYLCAVGIVGVYSWALLSSAILGATTSIRLPAIWGRRSDQPPRTSAGHRWTSTACGILLLIPAVFLLTAYLISNVE